MILICIYICGTYRKHIWWWQEKELTTDDEGLLDATTLNGLTAGWEVHLYRSFPLFKKVIVRWKPAVTCVVEVERETCRNWHAAEVCSTSRHFAVHMWCSTGNAPTPLFAPSIDKVLSEVESRWCIPSTLFWCVAREVDSTPSQLSGGWLRCSCDGDAMQDKRCTVFCLWLSNDEDFRLHVLPASFAAGRIGNEEEKKWNKNKEGSTMEHCNSWRAIMCVFEGSVLRVVCATGSQDPLWSLCAKWACCRLLNVFKEMAVRGVAGYMPDTCRMDAQ